MKKLLFVLAMVAISNVSSFGQTSSKTISFDTFKADYPEYCKQALAFANAGTKGSAATLPVGSKIEEVWTITEVPSRSQNKEEQTVLIYVLNGTKFCVLILKNDWTLADTEVKVNRGDGQNKYGE